MTNATAPLKAFTEDAQTGPFGSQLHSEEYIEDGIPVINPSNIKDGRLIADQFSTVSAETAIRLKVHRLRAGDLVFARRGELGRAAVVCKEEEGWLCGTGSIRVRANHDQLDPHFAGYALQSAEIRSYFTQRAVGSTMGNLNTSIVLGAPIPDVPLEEQCRIADFLDAETARIDRLVRAREAQISLLGQRLAQLVDGVVAGELEVLDSIGTQVDSGNWGHGKISRFCEVIPGYAFPSSAFVTDGSGIRLLRGINVGVGDLVWEDVVSWDTATYPVPDRFHLRAGDLVLGMDRPWISSGMRITLIDESHVPAFLLQRVACLRSKSPNINMHFIHWVLRSSQFRLGVESEMTGVSVPHLSGEQIGRFAFSLPALDEQTRLAASLEGHDSSTRRLQAAMTKQVSLLTERRHALITAAVTGQFDVSTASGRNVTDGVSA
ncbi:restriction endonuclease subunit S [Streptomyces platensis]|uniref:restriction endonuclease subunit S n=1 Tax=Streptomyces platensis TaxID=58346 RepID=UPI002ED57527|nr:restriction endonuclease subunit S [Streptomyces platensis]